MILRDFGQRLLHRLRALQLALLEGIGFARRLRLRRLRVSATKL